MKTLLRTDHVNSFLLTGYFSQRKKPLSPDLGPGAEVGIMHLPGEDEYTGPESPDYGPDQCDNCFENTFDCDTSPANCACSNLFDYEPFYADMECYTDPTNGTVVVGDVCDGNICHLNGCGDGIIAIINDMKWLFGSLFISYNLFFYIHLYRKRSILKLSVFESFILIDENDVRENRDVGTQTYGGCPSSGTSVIVWRFIS